MSILFLIGLLLSAGIGISLGLVGGGGSILTVPILVYFLGVGPHEAVPMSLAVVGSTSALGAFLHYRAGNIDLRVGLLFGVAGTAGAFLGSPLTRLVPPDALMLVFGGLMLVVAASMFWRRKYHESSSMGPHQPVRSVAAGLGVGVLTGFLGVGGGFLIVPALLFFGGLAMKKAVGTSLLVIFLSCIAGLVGHMGHEFYDFGLTGSVTVLAVVGAVAGTLLSRRLAAHRLQRLFAVLVLGVGAFLVVKNYAGAF